MSAWISFIKEFAKKNGISYGCALSDPNCSKEYRESKGDAKGKKDDDEEKKYSIVKKILMELDKKKGNAGNDTDPFGFVKDLLITPEKEGKTKKQIVSRAYEYFQTHININYDIQHSVKMRELFKELERLIDISKSAPEPAPAAAPAKEEVIKEISAKIEDIEPKLLKKLVLEWFAGFTKIKGKISPLKKELFSKSGIDIINSFRQSYLAHYRTGEIDPIWRFDNDPLFTPIKLVRYVINNSQKNEFSEFSVGQEVIYDDGTWLLAIVRKVSPLGVTIQLDDYDVDTINKGSKIIDILKWKRTFDGKKIVVKKIKLLKTKESKDVLGNDTKPYAIYFKSGKKETDMG
jgi:hypothetical protein